NCRKRNYNDPVLQSSSPAICSLLGFKINFNEATLQGFDPGSYEASGVYVCRRYAIFFCDSKKFKPRRDGDTELHGAPPCSSVFVVQKFQVRYVTTVYYNMPY